MVQAGIPLKMQASNILTILLLVGIITNFPFMVVDLVYAYTIERTGTINVDIGLTQFTFTFHYLDTLYQEIYVTVDNWLLVDGYKRLVIILLFNIIACCVDNDLRVL